MASTSSSARASAALGGGFKNFRPVKLVGATLEEWCCLCRRSRLVVAANSDIADFSLEQYRGNKPDATGDGPDAMFYYRDAPVDLFQYVRGAMSGGTYVFDPVYELKAGMDMLCHSLQERSKYVDAAIQAGIDKKNEPDFLPGNIYASGNEEWEAYATPSRDASLKNSFFPALRVDIMKFVFAAKHKDPSGVTEAALTRDLQKAYDEKAHDCLHHHLSNSVGRTCRLRLQPGGNPVCSRSASILITASSGAGAPAAPMNWRAARTMRPRHAGTRPSRRDLRNQAERIYAARARFTVSELENGAPGSGPKRPPRTDLSQLIANIGRGQQMAAMEPVGF